MAIEIERLIQSERPRETLSDRMIEFCIKEVVAIQEDAYA